MERRCCLCQRTQAGDGGGDDVECAVDLVGSGEAGEGEAQAGAGLGRGESHGEEDMRGLGGAGLAGRAEAGGDALHVERDEECLGVDAVEAQVGGVGRAVGGLGSTRTIDVRVGDCGEQALLETVAQGGELLWSVGVEPCEGEFGGAAEGDDAGDVFGAGSALALLRSPVEERRKMHVFADEEDACALRGVHLVAGDGEDVDVLERSGEVEWELGGGLYGVGVNEDSGIVGLGDAGVLPDAPNSRTIHALPSSLCLKAVTTTLSDDNTKRGFEGVGVDEAGARGSEVGDVDVAAAQGLRGIEDGVVLDLGGDDVGWLAFVDEGL